MIGSVKHNFFLFFCFNFKRRCRNVVSNLYEYDKIKKETKMFNLISILQLEFLAYEKMKEKWSVVPRFLKFLSGLTDHKISSNSRFISESGWFLLKDYLMLQIYLFVVCSCSSCLFWTLKLIGNGCISNLKNRRSFVLSYMGSISFVNNEYSIFQDIRDIYTKQFSK